MAAILFCASGADALASRAKSAFSIDINRSY
jgi:hypothetical protein